MRQAGCNSVVWLRMKPYLDSMQTRVGIRLLLLWLVTDGGIKKRGPNGAG